MKAELLIVTCSEPDALPFLLSLPAETIVQTTLVATGNVVRSALRQTTLANSSIITGLAAVDEVRRLVDSNGGSILVIVAPDPWGPINGKGFVRARLFAPWFLGRGDRADLVELDKGGRPLRRHHSLSRTALMRRLYVREAVLLSEYLLDAALGRPASRLVTSVGGQASRAAKLLSLPRAFVGSLLAPTNAAVTLCRVVPFILRSEARARLRRRDR